MTPRSWVSPKELEKAGTPAQYKAETLAGAESRLA